VRSFFGDIMPYSDESKPTLRREMSLPSSGLKNKQFACYCFHAGFLLGLFFSLENRGDIFLRNIGRLSLHYMALYAGR
jgi:hypothetical protein